MVGCVRWLFGVTNVIIIFLTCEKCRDVVDASINVAKHPDFVLFQLWHFILNWILGECELNELWWTKKHFRICRHLPSGMLNAFCAKLLRFTLKLMSESRTGNSPNQMSQYAYADNSTAINNWNEKKKKHDQRTSPCEQNAIIIIIVVNANLLLDRHFSVHSNG